MENKNKLRQLQLCELEILLEVDRICKDNNIPYFLLGGSLLGAVRHKGFIPWDDDIDIGMLRKDYDKFLSLCPFFLSDNYFAQNYNTDFNVPFSFSKIRKKGTAYINTAYPKNLMHQGIFIDIFPIDNAPNSKLLQRLIYIANWIEGCIANNVAPSVWWMKILYKTGTLFTSPQIYRKWLIKFSKYWNNKNTNYLNCYYLYPNTRPFNQKTACFKKEYILPFLFADFEERLFPIPYNSDYILKEVYGNYMQYPPLEEQKNALHGSILSLTEDFDEINY